MERASRQNQEVREFLLRNVEAHPTEVGALTAEHFGLSRTAISRYTKRLVDEGFITATGKTKAKRLQLKTLAELTTIVPVTKDSSESDIWAKFIEPRLIKVKPNVEGICLYGFTEIFNNVIDHSVSHEAAIALNQTYTTITLTVLDQGIGIFEKIQKDFNLPDARTALLELSKGKLTSDAKHHSGEGIFFSSRMFDSFSIRSGNLYYRRKRKDDWGWLIETDDMDEYFKGTAVFMAIATDADWTSQQVFEKFTADTNNDGAPLFVKTHVPLSLGKYGNEQLVSRSQAKRILARFDRFQEVFLDFEGVETIGQAFADEIFRVFRNQHSDIKIVSINTTPEIESVIRHVTEPKRGLINSPIQASIETDAPELPFSASSPDAKS